MKASPISLVLPDTKSKSYLINIFDTPGHPNFTGEMCSALRACDGVILVVDVVEGVMMGTEEIIKYLVQEKIKITVAINKIDRLILEMKIPPADAYLKIKHTIESINGVISKCVLDPKDLEKMTISPLLGNVVFVSSKYGANFTL